MVNAVKFISEVAFFGDGSNQEEAFPEELRLDAVHIARLFESLRYEETREVDLLETFTQMLLDLHPLAEKPFDSQLSLLETCAVLLEKQKAYPESLLELLATFAMRQLL